MATTTNYGWTTPDDTALVKDGASAIRTLGSSVDTTTKNLNPETTLGDISFRSSSSNVNTRLGLGTAGQLLAVNSGANAPEWKTVSTGGMTLLSTTTLSGASTTITTDFTGYNSAYISIVDIDISGNDGAQIKINNSTTITYMTLAYQVGGAATLTFENGGDLQFNFGDDLSGSTLDNTAWLQIDNPSNTVSWKAFRYSCGWEGSTGSKNSLNGGGVFATTSAITSIVLAPFTGGITFQGGTVKVYGVK
jgi:hypothetical protein